MAIRKKTRQQLARQRELILEKHYGTARAGAIRAWRDWLKLHEKQLAGAESLAWIEGFWNPAVPKYVADQVEGVLLSSTLVGKALAWRDAEARGVLDWAEKNGIETAGTGLKFTNWTEAPQGTAGEAWRWFRNKVPMTKKEFAALASNTHARAFTIAETENKLLVRTIKELASDSIKGDLTRNEFLKAAKEAWSTIGVTQANPYHLETALLTNIHSAANAARWQELNSDGAGLKKFFPYLQFFTVGDESVCDICGPLNGRTYKRDDPFWQVHYPPLHHRCRCLVEEVSVLDVELEGIKPDTQYPTSSPTYQPPARGFDGPPAELAETRLMVEALLEEIQINGRGRPRPYEMHLRGECVHG